MSDLFNPENLVPVLRMLSNPEASVVKRANKSLKPFLQEPTSAVSLVNVLVRCPEVACRQQAALLLTKKIGRFYSCYNRQQQEELKVGLVHLLVNEPDSHVATAIVDVICATAKAVFTARQKWPEIFSLPSILQSAQNPNERSRLLCFKLLTEVIIFSFIFFLLFIYLFIYLFILI
jgi:hypothetical protein